MSNKTVINKSGSGLKVHIPAFVVGQLGIEKGDQFEWNIKNNKTQTYLVLELCKKEADE